MIAPIQMQSFHVIDYYYRTNNEYEPNNEEIAIELFIRGKEIKEYSIPEAELNDAIVFRVNVESAFMKHEKQKDKDDLEYFRTSLSVSINKGDQINEDCPYELFTTVYGDFSATKIPKENYAEILNIIRVNTASMLYGLVRKLVIDMTNLSPFKPYIIPSLQFKEIVDFEVDIENQKTVSSEKD